MPVDFETYTPGEDGGLRLVKGSNAHAILQFLAEHPGTGFTPKEIADSTDMPRGSVGTTLARLEENDLVRHKEPYWSLGEDDRLGAYAAMIHGLGTAQDRFGDDDWSGWEARAVDPRGTDTGDGDG